MPTHYRSALRNPSLTAPRGIDNNVRNLADIARQGLVQPPATASPVFASSRGAILDLIRQIQSRDASSAAARGLSGTEFEIAQAGARNQAAVGGIRSAVSEAERMRQIQMQQAFQNLFAGVNLQSSRDLSLRGLKQQRDLATQQQLLSIILGAGRALGGQV